MSNIKKKIIIGTANFSKKYGVSGNKFNYTDQVKLLKFLKRKNIFYIDTAINYNIQNFLKKIKSTKQKFKLITKIPAINKNENLINKLLIQQLEISNQKKFDTILLHETVKIKNKNLKKSIDFLKCLKKKKITKKIGLSLYNLDDFNKIKKYFRPDVLQIPINILDQEFRNKKFISYCKKFKIEVHGRSIFLQGLLVSNQNSSKFIGKYFNILEKFCNSKNILKLDLCLNFVISLGFIDKIVIGLDNLNQLKEILNYKKTNKNFEIFDKATISKNITKPYKWKKKI